MRMFFSGAIEVELDKQGRINIPQNLRKYANLTKRMYGNRCLKSYRDLG